MILSFIVYLAYITCYTQNNSGSNSDIEVKKRPKKNKKKAKKKFIPISKLPISIFFGFKLQFIKFWI